MTRKIFGLAVVSLLMMILAFGCGNESSPVNSSPANMTPQIASKAIPTDAVIDSAFLVIYVMTNDSQVVPVHHITEDWTQNDVTWNNFNNAYDPDTVGLFVMDGTETLELDVTSSIQGWFDGSLPPYGFILRYGGEDTALASVNTKENAENNPYIRIVYTVHEGMQTMELPTMCDSYIYSAQPDMNYCDEEVMQVGGKPDVDSTYNALMEFNFQTEVRYGSIGDMVYNDVNGNGEYDEGEMGIEGVTVNLYDCEDTLIATTTTDADGMYMFTDLMTGDYMIEFIAPDGYMFSTPENGMTECMTILPGEEMMDVDAGLYLMPAKIGDYVWDDANMNGLQDEDEMGIEGIWVFLYDCEDNLVDSMMTDADGMYMFDNVDAGEYYLMFVNPFGYIFTYNDMGDDDALDSDVDRYMKTTPCFEVMNGDEAFDWDAGLFAYDGCTYGKGYWKNHTGFGPQDDEVTMLLPIWLGDAGGEKSMAVTDAQIAFDILQQHTYGHPSNGITKLYAHLLTAKLNIMSFANPEDVFDAINDADAFLAEHDWNDWDSLDKDTKKMVLQWKGHFEEYNEGEIGPGHCGDDDYDDDKDDYDYQDMTSKIRDYTY